MRKADFVVIVLIIGFLFVTATQIYGNVLRKERDVKRQAGIETLAISIRATKDSKDNTYMYTKNQFSKDYPKLVPQDPMDRAYCIKTNTSNDFASWDGLNCTNGWMNIPKYSNIDLIPTAVSSWTLCAQLEEGKTKVFCKSN